MEKLIVLYSNKLYNVDISKSVVTIINSVRITNSNDMKAFLLKIKKKTSIKDVFNKRSIKSMVREWKAHNLLYRFYIYRNRTKDVDLNINQPWYIRMCYFILSIFY